MPYYCKCSFMSVIRLSNGWLDIEKYLPQNISDAVQVRWCLYGLLIVNSRYLLQFVICVKKG